MRRRRGQLIGAGLVAAALLAAACTQTPPVPTEALCLAEFEKLDRLQRFYPATAFHARSDTYMQTPRIARQVETIRSSGCTTSNSDLAGIEQLDLRLEVRRITDGGAEIRPTALQVGIVTGMFAEFRAATLFGNLGYRYRSVGVEGLGRQVFVGPFRSQGALDEAIGIAHAAGFIAPYPSKYTRF